jgi:hypothetical protein
VIDLDISYKADVIMLFSFFGILIAGLLVNTVMFSLPKDNPTSDELDRFLDPF